MRTISFICMHFEWVSESTSIKWFDVNRIFCLYSFASIFSFMPTMTADLQNLLDKQCLFYESFYKKKISKQLYNRQKTIPNSFNKQKLNSKCVDSTPCWSCAFFIVSLDAESISMTKLHLLQYAASCSKHHRLILISVENKPKMIELGFSQELRRRMTVSSHLSPFESQYSVCISFTHCTCSELFFFINMPFSIKFTCKAFEENQSSDWFSLSDLLLIMKFKSEYFEYFDPSNNFYLRFYTTKNLTPEIKFESLFFYIKWITMCYRVNDINNNWKNTYTFLYACLLCKSQILNQNIKIKTQTIEKKEKTS